MERVTAVLRMYSPRRDADEATQRDMIHATADGLSAQLPTSLDGRAFAEAVSACCREFTQRWTKAIWPVPGEFIETVRDTLHHWREATRDSHDRTAGRRPEQRPIAKPDPARVREAVEAWEREAQAGTIGPIGRHMLALRDKMLAEGVIGPYGEPGPNAKLRRNPDVPPAGRRTA